MENTPRPALPAYLPFLLALLCIQGGACVLAFFGALSLLREGIAWEDAWLIWGYFFVFLVLGSPALMIVRQHPVSPAAGFKFVRVTVGVTMVVTLLVAPSPQYGWATLLALTPPLYIATNCTHWLPKE